MTLKKIFVGATIFTLAITGTIILSSNKLRPWYLSKADRAKTKVTIYYSQQPINIPYAVENAIKNLGLHEEQVGNAVSRLVDLDKKNQLNETEHEGAVVLPAIINGLTESKYFKQGNVSFYRYEIVNEGAEAVEYLEIVLPHPGYAEVYRTGEDTLRDQVSDKMFFGSLNANDRIVIEYWTDNIVDTGMFKVRGYFRGGIMDIKPLEK